MEHSRPKRVVYLFGAGATHAELKGLFPQLIEKGQGLLISDVSSRVIEKARLNPRYRSHIGMVSATTGSLNIELLISLIENSKVHDWEYKTRLLKKLVRQDIQGILTEPRLRHFYLHKALLEFHSLGATEGQEKLTGLISLNYEDVLDRAYEAYKQHYGEPECCLFPQRRPSTGGNIPLLKLHGSFVWEKLVVRGRRRPIEIIPLGSGKSYLHAPYRFIWNQALETLIGCDTLRVVGCSLSQNDFHLIDLLFQAHLEKGEAFEIEVIAPDPEGRKIRENYGFLPGIRTLVQIEGHLVPAEEPENAFREWLKYKALAVLGEEATRRTRYLSKVVR